MSYLKYAGLCSDMVRAALVPELRAKARTREVVYYRESVWKDGAPEKQSAPSCFLPPLRCFVPVSSGNEGQHAREAECALSSLQCF